MNHVILIGNLGQDAETKHTQGGAMIVSLNLATTSKWTDKQSGKAQERVEWHRCSAWGDHWKNVVPYLTKGTKVSVIGEIRYRDVEKDGVKVRYTDINVEKIELLGSKRDDGNAGYEAKREHAKQKSFDEVDDITF
jgi:single-strand DNA-binding protein